MGGASVVVCAAAACGAHHPSQRAHFVYCSLAQLTNIVKAKEMFASHVSHELRTPLNAVTGVISLLEGTPLTDEQRECTWWWWW